MNARHEPALGGVVAEALGLRWSVHSDPYDLGLDALAGLAVRRNLKRAQLIVSTVLAKHIPARPSAVRAAGLLLAEQVHLALTGASATLSGELVHSPSSSVEVDRLAVGSLPGAPAVIGFCETATSLGHMVADAFIDATYVHTTRRPDPALPTLLGFDEEHSHAVAHHLQPGEAVRDEASAVVLVDDELSTGTTALNTIAALESLRPGRSYVIAALLDLRPAASRRVFDERVAELGVSVTVASLLDGELVLPGDVLERAMAFEAELPSEPHASTSTSPAPRPISWPAGVAYGGRHGFTVDDRLPLTEAVSSVARALPLSGDRVLVLGTEELMYAPVRLAHALELAGHAVLVQSTTRSPVLPLDREGYAIRRRLVFASLDDPRRESFLYNVVPPRGGAGHYSDIVVVVEDESAGAAGLLAALQPFTDTVHVVAVA